MLKLLKYLRPYWLSVIALVSTLAGQIFCALQLPALMSKIVNDGILAGNPDMTWKMGINMLGFTLLSVLLDLITHYFSARVGAAFSRDLRNDFYRHVLSLSNSEIDKFSTASLITRTTNDISQVQNAAMMMLTMLLRAPLMGIGAIIQAFRTAPDMTWILALAVVTILVFSISILSIVIPKFKIYQKLIDRLTLLARENLTGLRVIRAFNNEKKEKKKFSSTNSELTKLTLFISKLMSLEDPLIGIVLNGTTLLVVWVGLKHLETDLSYLGNTIAFVQYASSVIIAFLILTMLFVVLPRANVSAARINEVFKTKSKIKFPETTQGSPEKTPSVEFQHVDFAYPGAEENVLSDISFLARAGETTAFIGSTGSGKSTLISLVPRFFDPTAGKILLNNLDLKSYSEDDLMKKIGYVPQRGILFAGTVKSNIAFGTQDPDNPDKKLLETAAEISQSKEFIEKLEKKYDSHIAQGGTNVSGGQKQRLSIARAIAKRPEVYIFDDSFSALDMKTDKALRACLKPETKNSVVLVVAQRINTIKSADQIIVLDNGKIVGKGTHQTLLRNCKIYREIVKSQFSEAEYERELAHASK